jgi:opacity protein-like surface antigen
MKKLVITLAIMLCTGSVFARSVKGTSYIGGYTDLGIAMPSGTVPSGIESDSKFGYALGLDYGYGATDSGVLLVGLAYEYRPIALKLDQDGMSGKCLFKQSFLTANLGWRFLFSSVYADLGMFYGIKLGKGKAEGSGDLSDLSGDLTSKEGKNPFGINLGLGYLAKVSDKVQLDIGAKYKFELTNQFESKDGSFKLKSNNLSLTLGLNYSL